MTHGDIVFGPRRCYLVSVGTSLIGKCERATRPRTWSFDEIDELDNPVKPQACTHEACMQACDDQRRNDFYKFTKYGNAYYSIQGWLKGLSTNENEWVKCSAELSSLYRGVPENEAPGGNDTIILIHTNTPAGCLSARLLKEALSRRVRVVCEKVCEGIGRMDAGESVENGIPELTQILRKLIIDQSKKHDVFLVPTGGYKSIIPYFVVVGMLLQKKVKEIHYIYEDSDKRLVLPIAPLGIDLPEWHSKAFLIGLSQFGVSEARERLRAESPRIADRLRERPGGGYKFDDFGELLWDEYHSAVMGVPSMVPHRLPLAWSNGWAARPKLAQSAIRFMEEWEHLWEGHPSQHVDHTRAHCHNLIRLMESLLERMENFLCPEELYLLTSAIWLHDIGYGELYYQETEDSPPEPLGLSRTKKLHHKLSAQRIRRKAKDLGFDDFESSQEAKLLALLCLSHRGPDTVREHMNSLLTFTSVSLPSENGVMREARIRALLLACLLVVLDTSDMGIPRAGGEKFRQARIKANKDEVEAKKKMLDLIPKELCCLPEEVQKFINKYRDILKEDLNYLEPSEEHFNYHAKVALTTFDAIRGENGGWCVILNVHPVPSMQNIIVEKVNEFWHVGAHFEEINTILQQNGYDIRFCLGEGHVLNERDVVTMDR